MTNQVGKFMVGVGAIIEHSPTGKILLMQRSLDNGFNPGVWETVFGRVDQGESAREGMLREIEEEVGLTDVTILHIINDFHIYRGEKVPENEMNGFVFYATTETEKISISSEHEEFAWVTPEEALEYVTEPSIRAHFVRFLELRPLLQDLS